ncbi:shikimate kinase/glutaredoxin-related protein [Rhizobium leguminosarum]|nr:shikimate kinase/glutaredoxin-related protein [Rhizobium leguminosarum]
MHRLAMEEDLHLAELQLDSAAKKRLQAERERSQQQLNLIAQNHNAGLCVSMARDNELARRFAGGLALPFLEARVNAQTNAQWLDTYLRMIANARRVKGAGIRHGDLDRCTELAAQYLCETRWFEGVSLEQLAHVGNKLSKHPNQQACMDAIAWIAGRLEQADDLSGLSGTPSALLLNAFAKNINSGRCERAVARLARYLQRDDQARQSLNAQDIGLALNAFSKWYDNPDCQSMAHSLAALLASDSRLRHAMAPQGVANALNALSKWPDTAVCKNAANALAGRLAGEPRLRKGLEPQGVANALNALSKWPDTAVCKNAAKALAGRLADEPTLRKALTAQEVANALNALSKWPDTAVCAEAANALAGRLADEPRLRKALNAQEVANALNALSKWPDTAVCAEAVNALAGRLADEPRLCKALEPQGVANALNALSKWPDTAVCAEAANALAGRLADEPRLCKALEPQGVANALNALSKWPDTAVCAEAANALAGRLADEPRLRKALNAQEVANALNALSKWPDTAVCAEAVNALAGRLADEPTLSNTLNAQEVANALNALSKWPDTAVCAEAANALAGRLADEPTLRKALTAQQVANALNALSKWPDTAVCAEAAGALAGRLADEPTLRKALNAQEVANALNALSKWPDTAVCAEAANALAGRLADEPTLRNTLNAQEVANALNALSKWPDTAVCAEAAGALAGRLADEPTLRKAFTAQQVANALNALSKWPDTAVCAEAAGALAGRLADEPTLRNTLTAQQVANALNALSKWPDTAVCAEAVKALAGRLADEPTLRKALDPQGVANALNALSKWPDTAVCAEAANALAGRLADEPTLRKALDPQGVANALNALSKWPDTAVCAEAVKALAGRLADEPTLRKALDPQGVANALNALSKWPDTAVCAEAANALAGRLADEPTLRNTLNAQEVANALNALSKWPDTAVCAEAIDVLASRLAKDHDLRQAMDAQGVANALNALSRCLGRPACQTAGLLLAERAGLAELPWQRFEMRGITMVANAMSRLRHLDEEQLQTLGGAKLQAMAGHLELHRERFESASVLDIGMLFKALAAARLHRQMRPLARPALERVSVLVGDDRLRETNLESIGNLCMGLLPLIRSPELKSRHRGHALRVFNTLQPIVERKIDLYLTGGDSQSSTDIDQHATRCPALTFFQVLKAYSMVSRQWKPRHVEGTRQELLQRRDQLATWVDRTLERTREAIEADLGEMSWNLIAQIEAGDQTFDALDLRMAKEAPTITQAHPPTSFDLDVGRLSMRSAPGQPGVPANGSTTHVVVDLQGKEVGSNNATETNQQYSLFARLTGLPLVEVQLPGAISTFMLARTFNYQGEPWRFDLFGGSRATRGNMSRPAQLLSGTSAAPSLLPAIRYADTAPGSSLMTLVAKLAPQREDWSRMQRSLLEMVPSDHVIEGTLRLGFFEDVSGPAHPFKPLAVDGRPLALCPNDGCGFLKLEVALCIPAFRKHYDAWQAVQAGQASQEQRDLLANDKGPTRLAPQALQHFPRDEEALQEAQETMRHRLEALPPELSQLTLFELATSGGYQGQRVRAVPSADDKVHLPRERSQAFDAAGGPLLIGKPPYDKENLLPVPEERVATVAKGDATAEFLSQSFGIQYSYTGFDDRSGDDAQMLHSKGMLIVVPEKNWPADFVNTDLVCSKEDLKTLSCWTAGRDRSAVPRDMLSTGSLRLKDIVEPGRMGALPIAELRTRNMDTDGDDAFVYAGYPRLAALIAREMADREDRRGQPQSFKPPKTATPAIDRETGHYKAGRLSEIMSLQRGGQIMGAASNLAARFMAQPDQLREAMARNMMFGTYDGIERALRNGLREVLEGDARDSQVLEKLRADARNAIERAHMPEAREAAQLLHAQLLRLDQQADVPQLPDALAEAFPNLAKAYVAAPSAEARIHAILDNYPVCRLSHAQFPAGQPGLIPDEPELTMRNLFTIAIKVGTDALKSDTGTELFAKIVEACERSERGFAERVRVVPYSKATARAMHDGRFDAEQTKELLQHMPTMAAGVMQDALHALQQARLIDPPPPPVERLRDVRTEDITLNAKSLLTRARDMEPVVTEMLNRAAKPYGGRLVGTLHQLKSLGSLKEKLEQQMALKKQTLEEATAGVNDALRYSVALNPEDFTVGLRGVLALLDDQGHVRVKSTNTFTKPRPAFKAVNVTLRSPKGALWEIQFHTPQTFEIKEQFHDRYKRNHALQMKGAPLADQWELLAPAQEAFSRVDLPPACEEIDDWETLGSDRKAALPAAEILHFSSSGESGSRVAGTSRSRAVARKQIALARSPKAGEILAALGTRPVVLVGMPSSGKSTIGPQLAKELGVEFVDTDKRIVAEHGNIIEMFADPARGEAHFRDLETKELAKQLERGPIVIATGGGGFNKEANRALILDKARSIWLDTKLTEVCKRLKWDTTRPLLQGVDVEQRTQKVQQQYEERSPFYEEADIRLPLVPPLNDKKDARTCVDKLYAFLCSDRKAALPAAEISHVSGASGTAASMAPTAQRMHDDHHNRGEGVVETIQAPAAPLSEAERPPPLHSLTAAPQPLLAGSNARADLASSTRSRERSSRGR